MKASIGDLGGLKAARENDAASAAEAGANQSRVGAALGEDRISEGVDVVDGEADSSSGAKVNGTKNLSQSPLKVVKGEGVVDGGDHR